LTVALLGAVFLIAWVVTGHSTPAQPGELPAWVGPLVTIVSYGVAGAVFIDRRPDLIFGWLLAGVAVLIVAEVLVTFPAADAVAGGDHGALARWGLTPLSFSFLPVAAQGLVNVRFPSGRPASRAGRLLEVAIVAGTVLVVAGGFFGSSLGGVVAGAPTLSHPLTDGTPVGQMADGLVALAPVVILLGLIAGLGVVWRFVRAEGLERQQLKWRAVGVLAGWALFPLAATDRLHVIAAVDSPLFVLTLVVPVLRYRLWAIDTILRRSAGYAVVTAMLVAGYVAVAATITRVASAQLAAPVAAAVVAMSFAPLARWVQGLVDRLFYGDRGDPYRTLRELGRRLNMVPDGDLLDSLAQDIATSLRLPYVAVEGLHGIRMAGYGEAGPSPERWPLVYEQQVEGFLVASPRRGEDGFDARDRDLLGAIAQQVGVAVHAVGLTTELLRSRQRLVTAREEERRRLRRDLHDGLGPVLTAVGLNLDAARARLANDRSAAERHIVEAKQATTHALADLRHLVHDLRPPALDLGLADALRVQVERLRAGSDLSITVEAAQLPELPAAVEVAVFRIAVEAVTNTVRHGRARHCWVRIASAEDDLVLQVTDDGQSDRPWTPGVGLTAMRERTDELGGTLEAGPTSSGGAGVVARFPLPQEHQ
jgi:two-component system, NarL family, sensor kinase